MTALLNSLSKIYIVLLLLFVCSCDPSDEVPVDDIKEEPEINDPNRDYPIDPSETFTQEELNILDGIEPIPLDWDNIILPSGRTLKEANDADLSNGRLERSNSTPAERKEEIIKIMSNEARRLMKRSDFIKTAGEVEDVRPAQPNGLAYGLGLKDYTRRENPTGPCYEEVFGLDCSGLLNLLVAKAGIIGAPEGSEGQSNETLWNAALLKDKKNEGLTFKKISNLSSDDLESGDLMIWNGHVGVYEEDGKSKQVLQSNGGSGKHCLKNGKLDEGCIKIEHEGNRGLKRGPWSIPITDATKKVYWGTNFTVLRLEASNPWFKELIGRWTYQAYFKLSDELYEQYKESYEINNPNNPCGIGYTLIGEDSILGNNTILWYEPVLLNEMEFFEDSTMDSHTYHMFKGIKGDKTYDECTKLPNGSITDLKWNVTSTGYISGSYSQRPITGQLVKIDENTYYSTYRSCLSSFCNSSYTLFKRM